MDKAGIKLIGPGDIADDELLPSMGDAMLGTITAHFYSAAHPSPMNKAFVDRVPEGSGRSSELHGGQRLRRHAPIYEALRKSNGVSRRRHVGRGNAGDNMGKPARTDLHRSKG